MDNAPQLTISKLDAARRQLDTALRIFFGNGDPVSIHTLAGAAYNILRDISKALGAQPMLIKDVSSEWIRPEMLKEAKEKLNEAENFFKHADRDPSAFLNFWPGQTELFLFDACMQYQRITGEVVPTFLIFNVWFTTHHQDLFNLPSDISSLIGKASPELLSNSRSAFFAKMLPIVSTFHA